MKKRKLSDEKALAAKKLAHNIADILRERGISQRKLAETSRINTSTINNIITGKVTKFEWYHLFKIAEALDMTIDSLIAGIRVEIVDSPEIREIIEAMPPEAKLFFRSTKRIPKENVKVILDMIKLSIKEIDAPPKKIRK